MDSNTTPNAKQKIRTYHAYDAHGNPVAPCNVKADAYRKCETCKHKHPDKAFMQGFGPCVYCSGGPLCRRADAREVSFALFSKFTY